MRTIAAVVSMLRTILVAVPGLEPRRAGDHLRARRPARSSGRRTSAARCRGSQVTKMIFEPALPRAGQRAAHELRHAARRHADDDVLLGRPQAVRSSARLPRSCPRRLPARARIARLPPAMIACTRSGSVPKVGGISADSRTPSRPLVPAPTKTMRPPLRSAWRDDLDADRDALLLRWHGREHLAVFVEHQLDDVGGGELVDAERGGVDGFGGERLPLRVQGHGGTKTAILDLPQGCVKLRGCRPPTRRRPSTPTWIICASSGGWPSTPSRATPRSGGAGRVRRRRASCRSERLDAAGPRGVRPRS